MLDSEERGQRSAGRQVWDRSDTQRISELIDRLNRSAKAARCHATVEVEMLVTLSTPHEVGRRDSGLRHGDATSSITRGAISISLMGSWNVPADLGDIHGRVARGRRSPVDRNALPVESEPFARCDRHQSRTLTNAISIWTTLIDLTHRGWIPKSMSLQDGRHSNAVTCRELAQPFRTYTPRIRHTRRCRSSPPVSDACARTGCPGALLSSSSSSWLRE